MQTKKKLLQDIKAFLAVTEMQASTFGRLAANNSRLVAKLEKGGTISIDIFDRVNAYMRVELAKRGEESNTSRPLPGALANPLA